MRIAHVTPVFPPRGGIGTVASEYAESLRALGDDVTVFTPRYGKGIVSFGNAALMPGLIWRLKGFDVIHLHYPFYGGDLFALIASVIWKTPLVLTYHMKTKASGWLGLIFKLHRIVVEPIMFSGSIRILVSSKDYATSIGLAHARLQELPFGVDTARFTPSSSQKQTTTFLFVGGMDSAHYFKGIPVFLRALAQLPKDAQWRAVLVGGGERLDAYQKLATDLQLDDRVYFAGRVSAEELPNYYREASVHVLPSIDRSEAFGLVTLEAAASGLPSIVSDLPGVRTLVEPDVTGFLVVPGDEQSLSAKLEWVIKNPDEIKKMGESARNRVVQKYALTEIAKKLHSLYERVTVPKL